MKENIYVEDIPKDWEEEFALNSRELKQIDKNVIIKAMQNTTYKLENYFEKYNINFEVSSDLKSYINIKDFKKIQIKYTDDDKVEFSLSGDNDYILIRIQIRNCYYIIEYVNADNKEIRVRYNIDECVIEKLFGELLHLNRK
ncbi:hypothetical protein [Clostridium botulinum]|uniref:hypothetical protein n=1 Tax=Clostridium botulinum TaxID=1491 RepID=UPI000470DD3D|nr:hypothetical protein [Clostridium botulinum]QDY18249.1 hypothetical protein CGQ27_14595 [Clostridium botulinum]